MKKRVRNEKAPIWVLSRLDEKNFDERCEQPNCTLACWRMLKKGQRMTWNRQKSDLETMMVEVLKKKKTALSLGEVVSEIEKIEPQSFTGKTPVNSLYSIIYRREKRRTANGNQKLFIVEKDRNYSVYSLNPKCKEIL